MAPDARSPLFFMSLSFFWLFGCATVQAAPLDQTRTPQKISITTQRRAGGVRVLKEPLEAKAAPTGIEWQYLPDSYVSVPFLTLTFDKVHAKDGNTIIVEKMGRLKPGEDGRYTVTFPLTRKVNALRLTIVDPKGSPEDWDVTVKSEIPTTAVYVDRSCADFKIKIKELKRGTAPNLFYLGCRPGTMPHHLSLDVFWSEARLLAFQGKELPVADSVVTLPLSHKEKSKAQLLAIGHRDERSVYLIEYEPNVPKPYEIWAGLAFFRTSFSQSNFSSRFSQIATAFAARAWYRPEDTDFSFMLRGFGTLFSVTDKLDPEISGQEESVGTYFVSGELRYKVLDQDLWRISPFLGGWLFFMNVKSGLFGLQRVITPIFGFSIERSLSARDKIDFTTRIVSLQSFPNPFSFTTDESYFEFELSYAHSFLVRNRFFVTLSYGILKYAPEGSPETRGSYLVLGGGYGW